MDSTTNTSLAMGACPPLEDIAAFLDGMLPAEERERIVAHLADCEACYQMFAGAADFLTEAGPSTEKAPETAPQPRGKVIRFPFPNRRPALGWLAAAALVVFAVGLGLLAYRNYSEPEVTLADLATPLASKPFAAGNLYQGSVMRGPANGGPGPLSIAPEFMVGVRLVDLRLSAPQGDRESTERSLQGIADNLKDIFGAENVQDRYSDEYLKLNAATSDEAGPLLISIANELPAREKELEELTSVPPDLPQWTRALMDALPRFLAKGVEKGAESVAPSPPGHVAFGKWAEAGRVAAQLRESEFFTTEKNRRFLRWLLRYQDDIILEREDQQVLTLLHEIEKLWDVEGSAERDNKRLATTFEKIIDHYHQATQ